MFMIQVFIAFKDTVDKYALPFYVFFPENISFSKEIVFSTEE